MNQHLAPSAPGRVATAAIRFAALVSFLALASACAGDATEDVDTDPVPREVAQRHETEIQTPASLRGLETELRDPLGRKVTVRCATCHSDRDAPLVQTTDELDEFHTGLTFAHGDLSCASCHHPTDRDLLRRADGEAIAMTEAMTLCAQCHGPQRRDYRNGSHGGMTGHWDLARGGRERNHCIDCHDPHAPAFPTFWPMPPPNDRFFAIESPDGATHE